MKIANIIVVIITNISIIIRLKILIKVIQNVKYLLSEGENTLLILKCAMRNSLACLLRILALREVKESILLLAFGQCIMKLLGSNIIFRNRD